MTRRSVPRISPNDLRDHADEARIARVWDRIEHDLSGFEAPPKRGSRLAYLAVAAAFAAFGGGLFVGKLAFQERTSGAVAVVASPDRSTVDVLAAGSEGRTFTLPGGGTLTLQPGATVEIERGGTSTLKLLQGEASIDTTGAGRAAGLVIVAGDARLNTQAGSALNVRRNQDDVDVSVRDGSVSITSPAGSRKLDRGQSDAVPIHAPTSALSQSDSPLLARGARGVAHARRPNEPRAADPPVVAAASLPGWRAAYNNNDIRGALDLLRQEPGGIDGAINSAKSGSDLMAIYDVVKKADANAATNALKRVVERFPDGENAQIAAYQLAKIFTANGQADLAKRYQDLASSGQLGPELLCRQFLTEQNAGHKDEALRKAQEYVAKYPDGPCRSNAESILQGEGSGQDGDHAPAGDGSAPEKAPAATGSPATTGSPVAPPASASAGAPSATNAGRP